MSVRFARLERSVYQALAGLIPGSIRDPRAHLAEAVVVTKVALAPDLSSARVLVTVKADGDEAQREVFDALRRAAGYLRKQLGQRVKLRRLPELKLILDHTPETAGRVEEILRELAKERRAREGEEAEPGQADGDSEPLEEHDGAVAEGGISSGEPRSRGARPRDNRATAAQIAERLRAASRVLITTHPHPDGDAAGSLSAAMVALTRLGKDVVGFNPDQIPDRYCFLSCLERVVRELPEEGFELTLLLDCTDERMFEQGVPSREYLGCVVALDHHKTSSDFADLCLRDPSASSAGVVLARVLDELGVELDRDLAEALYCSLISDTGSFRYQNTNPEAMRLGARLLEVGVDPWRVASNLYESQTRGQIELLGEVLRTLRTSDDGLVGVLTVTWEMLRRTGCNMGHVDGMINYARGVEGVQVATLLRVGDDHLRVSMRSRGVVDVSAIAVGFGGGGHKNAAGFTVDLETDDVLARLFTEVAEACREAGIAPPAPGSAPTT